MFTFIFQCDIRLLCWRYPPSPSPSHLKHGSASEGLLCISENWYQFLFVSVKTNNLSIFLSIFLPHVHVSLVRQHTYLGQGREIRPHYYVKTCTTNSPKYPHYFVWIHLYVLVMTFDRNTWPWMIFPPTLAYIARFGLDFYIVFKKKI